MPELKTLKDIFKKHDREIENAGYWMDAFLNFNSDVRAEAIKWIKQDELDISVLCPAIQQLLFKIMRRWKERFNISEDDLK
jgi:hypothetical protein